jgi:hypothetical protein
LKTRTQFVSNSSSSSFILNFDKEIKTKEELKEKLFPNQETITEFDHWDDKSTDHSTNEVVEYIFNEFKSSSENDVLDELTNDYDYDWNGKDNWSWDKWDKKGYNKTLKIDRNNWFLKIGSYDYEDMLRRIEARKDFKEILKTLQHPYIVYLEDKGKFAFLEYDGDIFDQFLIRKISNH